ncbi:MBL fold metallo-hydrolase [Sphingomonas sp. NPDC019816]|uniref:MBL fold metallo-hydrolase n=1 Tax=Sphingomonas sp. NPDC019816 TaxID=3390679 RepID=UPI003D014D08
MPLNDTLGTTLTPANHSAGRSLSDQRMALWSGHWLETPVGTVWFAGGTGYGDGAMFRNVRERLGSRDVALIPIGAYEPRWFMEPLHVNPSEAVQIFHDVDACHALGIHWGTFQLTNEARDAPKRALADALAAANLPASRFVAAEPGFVYDFAISARVPPLEVI